MLLILADFSHHPPTRSSKYFFTANLLVRRNASLKFPLFRQLAAWRKNTNLSENLVVAFLLDADLSSAFLFGSSVYGAHEIEEARLLQTQQTCDNTTTCSEDAEFIFKKRTELHKIMAHSQEAAGFTTDCSSGLVTETETISNQGSRAQIRQQTCRGAFESSLVRRTAAV